MSLPPRWCLSSPTTSAAPGVTMSESGRTTTVGRYTAACTETSGVYLLVVLPAVVFNSLPAAQRISITNRTNLPKEVMMFPDFPFDSRLKSFMPHQEVQRYLEQYCQSHNIQPHIKVSHPVHPAYQRTVSKIMFRQGSLNQNLFQFNTAVEHVKPVVVEGGERKGWEVISSDSLGRQKKETFDSVLVCSG